MNELIKPTIQPARIIKPIDAIHFERDGFSGYKLIHTDEGAGYNALLIDVHGRHFKTGMKGATRNYLVMEGNGTFTMNGEIHTVQKGDLYIIPDGNNYEYEGNMQLFEFNVPGTTRENETNLDK